MTNLNRVRYYMTLLSLLLFFSADLKSQDLPLQADLDTLNNISQFDLSAEPVFNLKLTEPIEFSDSNLLIGTISSVTSDSEGRVYIADRDQLTIHQFRADGSYLESFGRDGEGPGEFRSLIKLRYRNGLLYALDRNLNRISAFSTESFEIESTIPLSGGSGSTRTNIRSMPEEFFVLPDNRFLLTFSLFAGDSDQLYFQPVDILHPNDGYEGAEQLKIPVQQSVMFQNSGSVGVVIPVYGRNGTLYATQDGTIYTNWSENLLLKQYDSSGEYIRAWFNDIDKLPLTRQQLRERYSDRYMDILSNEELPDTWPAIRSFLVDNKQRFWIEIFTEEMSESEWIIVSKDSELLGRMKLPADNTIHLVRKNLMYVTESDNDGFEYAKRYRVVFE